jgi:hypothetical protein
MRKAIEILENSNNNNNKNKNNLNSINFKTFNNDMILIYTSKIITLNKNKEIFFIIYLFFIR